MKNIRKTTGSILMLLSICFVFAAFKPVSAKAAPAVSEQNFAHYYTSSDYSYIGVDLSIPSGYYADTQVLYSGYVIGEARDNITYATVQAPLQKNAVYEYRIRIHKNSGSRATDYSNWTGTRVFTTLKPNGFKLVSRYGKTVKTRIPTVAGARKVVLKMSTKKNSGYKNVATFTKGKLYKTSKYRGKTFVKYKNYYYKFVVYAANGRKCENVLSGYFYIY